MSETNDYFERAESPRKLRTGTAGEWFDNVLGQQFDCDCNESFVVKEKHIGLSSGRNLPGKMDVLKSELLGRNAYDVSDDTVENGLFTQEGMLVQGYIKCPYCIYQHGHHTDYLQSQGRGEFQPPYSKYMERTGE